MESYTSHVQVIKCVTSTVNQVYKLIQYRKSLSYKLVPFYKIFVSFWLELGSKFPIDTMM